MSSGSMPVCSDRQKKVLEMLLDKYERSRTYRGTNQVEQRFSVDPARIFPVYRRDTTSVEKVEAFESELEQLRSAGLVTLERRGGEIAHILMDKASLSAYYSILGRRPRAEQEKEELAWYRGQRGAHAVIDRWCEQQIGRLEQGKKAVYPLEETEPVFRALRRILCNREEILERELSIDLFGDSKAFEKSVRRKACRVMRESGLYDEVLEGIGEARLIEQVLLGEHLVVSNPTYLYMKGRGRIRMEGGGEIVLQQEDPVAISSRSLPRIREIEVEEPAVLTVENLTSFQRMICRGQFLLYLGGYHNTAKSVFLRRIAKENPGLRFLHFGDLDPDGFLIIEHLRRRTGLDFRPWKMGTKELERYIKYAKPLEELDRVKAENLLTGGRYEEVLRFMLDRGLKLEQEIISWKEG